MRFNVLPDGEKPIAMLGSVAAAAIGTEEQPTKGQKEIGRQCTERSSSRLNDLWDGSISPPPPAQSDNSQKDTEIQAAPADVTQEAAKALDVLD